MKTTLSTKGQMILPAKLRKLDGLEAGQEFEIRRIERGEYRLIAKGTPKNQGLVKWLLSCPVKGYFEPIESESTDLVDPFL